MESLTVQILSLIAITSSPKTAKTLRTAARQQFEFELAAATAESQGGGFAGGVWLNAEEIAFVNDGRKLPAVKSYKNRTGCSLMEGKNAVEDYMEATLGYRYAPVHQENQY